jgi:hypothetical protein
MMNKKKHEKKFAKAVRTNLSTYVVYTLGGVSSNGQGLCWWGGSFDALLNH